MHAAGQAVRRGGKADAGGMSACLVATARPILLHAPERAWSAIQGAVTEAMAGVAAAEGATGEHSYGHALGLTPQQSSTM